MGVRRQLPKKGIAMFYKLDGHSFGYQVLVLIQAYYPQRKYEWVDSVQNEGSTIESGLRFCRFYENGVLIAEKTVELPVTSEKEQKKSLSAAIFLLLKEITGIRLPWGTLSGIRPAKTAYVLFENAKSEDEVRRILGEEYFVQDDKISLSVQVASATKRIEQKIGPGKVSLYVGIPFCPSICVYCSFTSFPLKGYDTLVEPYINALKKELEFIKSRGYSYDTVYIGGGTPTVLSVRQLDEVLCAVREVSGEVSEFTVEAGRPDTITAEKLQAMRHHDVNRISINPQTLNQKTLDLILRKHTVHQFYDAYDLAVSRGFRNINVDLILALPGERPDDVETTMRGIKKLSPGSVTVHNLAVKRGSFLHENFEKYYLANRDETEQMLKIANQSCLAGGLKPYYMYKLKNMVGNLENVGYCKPGFEGLYNVLSVEERQTIISAGAGGATKLVNIEKQTIKRSFNVKNVGIYIEKIDEMIERKRDFLKEGAV